MPWTIADVDSHIQGLNQHQKVVWVAAANNALRQCLADGGSQSECDGRAIRIANAAAQAAKGGPIPVETKVAALDDFAIEDTGSGKFSGYASVFNQIDLVGDTVLPGAYVETIPKFVRDGFIAWGHDWDNPIATIDIAREDQKGLWVEATFHSHPFAQQIRAIASERLQRGKSMGLSIGFKAKDWELRKDGVRELRTVDLAETSLVTFPAEPNAQVSSVKFTPRETKGAIPSHTTPKADEGTSWDAGAAVGAVTGAAALRRMHAWVDSNGDPEAKASYKFPHHLPNGNVVWRGVAAAMGVLMGARGGADIPTADESGVYNHLARHYAQFDREPPAKGAPKEDLEEKEGRMFSARNMQKLKDHMGNLRSILKDLEALLASAEPGENDGSGEEKGDEQRLDQEGLRAWAEFQKTLANRRLRW